MNQRADALSKEGLNLPIGKSIVTVQIGLCGHRLVSLDFETKTRTKHD
jgi:hypothetical protein